MQNVIRFWVSGTPRPAGSKRAVPNPRTGRIMIFDASGTNGKNWRKAVQAAAQEEVYRCGWMITSEALDIACDFHLNRPQSHYLRHGLRLHAPEQHTQKPDATKLLRSVEDSLTGILWQDDSQIVRQFVRKSWVTGSPGVWVCVRLVSDLGLVHVRD